jgi:two-component system, OmpR family, response regulator VicR
MKILFVEDSKSIRGENKSALYQSGYEAICTENGGKALQWALEQQPDLILLDRILPKVSGPVVLRQRKREPPYRRDSGGGS